MEIPDRYSLANLSSAIRNPSELFYEARRIALRINAAYTRFRGLNGDCDVVKEDWDTLVILDGCRYDLFKKTNTIDGRLESRRSAGSESWQFLQENFQGRELHDTVYVTANPHAPKLDGGTFHRRINLLDSRWDEDLQTVPPDAVTQEAIAAHKKHPHKRLIVHYMQPHFPFIGKKGQKIAHTGVSREQRSEAKETPHVWNGLRDGKISATQQEVYDAYRENLELALPQVRRLLNSIDGKSIITADHGNLVGERTRPIPVKSYGHPRGFYTTNLITIPWLVIEADDRRIVEADEPREQNGLTEKTVERRLSDLGYK